MYKIFGRNMVAIVFQNVFYLKMHQNNIFIYFLKIIFDINISKWSENTKNISIWSKKNKKFSNFFKNVFETQKQIGFYEIQLKKHVKITV
jgi:hypothetical protein